MKKTIKQILTLTLSTVLLFENSICVGAADKSYTGTQKDEYSLSAEQIFNAEEIEKLKEKVRRLPIHGESQENHLGVNANNPLKNSSGKTDKTKKKIIEERGKYSERRGTILVTGDAYKGLVPLGHAAIVFNSDECIESLKAGVVKGKMDWRDKKEEMWEIRVTGVSLEDMRKVAKWCEKQIGKKYNYDYLHISRRDKFYCSHLVYAGYYDVLGIDLNTSFAEGFYPPLIVKAPLHVWGNPIHPIELVISDDTYEVYYLKQEFKKK